MSAGLAVCGVLRSFGCLSFLGNFLLVCFCRISKRDPAMPVSCPADLHPEALYLNFPATDVVSGGWKSIPRPIRRCGRLVSPKTDLSHASWLGFWNAWWRILRKRYSEDSQQSHQDERAKRFTTRGASGKPIQVDEWGPRRTTPFAL